MSKHLIDDLVEDAESMPTSGLEETALNFSTTDRVENILDNVIEELEEEAPEEMVPPDAKATTHMDRDQLVKALDRVKPRDPAEDRTQKDMPVELPKTAPLGQPLLGEKPPITLQVVIGVLALIALGSLVYFVLS